MSAGGTSSTSTRNLGWKAICMVPILIAIGLSIPIGVCYSNQTMSSEWVPGPELGTWLPSPWPPEHTETDGRVQAFKDSGGRWQNPWMLGRASVMSFFYDWFIGGRDESKIPGQAELDKMHPIKEPLWVNNTEFTPSNARMTWLGHATVLAEVDGCTILADPVFSSRASFVSFAGPKRYRKAACSVSELPKITAVVISHNHLDHLDLNSVSELMERQPNISWFVPMGTKQWMVDNARIPQDKVTESVWWEETQLKTESGSNLTFAFTPANHWCKRGVMDDNKMLWGSWAVLGPTHRFWFAGDTGYCEAFKQIGKKYGPFHMAAIPIGAYQPNWFMKYQHVHPGEAVEIHKDIHSLKSLGIHWGTFKLTTEFYLEPPTLLSTFMNRLSLDASTFVSTNIGESVEYQDNKTSTSQVSLSQEL